MKKNWLEILILIVVVAAVTLPALRGGFISDDHKLIESRAPLFATPGAYRVLPMKMYFWGTSYDAEVWHDYRPWISLTYWFHHQLAGTNPFIYHFSNWIVHIINAALIFFLMRWFMGGGAALIIALFTGVCPAALTSVGWISGRPDVWATFFVLIFLWAFRAALRTRNSWPHIAAAAAFFMALASKEVAIVAPVIAWALDRYSRSTRDAGEISERKLWHYLVLLIPLGIYLPLKLAATGTMLPPVVKSFFTSLPFLAEQMLRSIASVFLPLHYRFFTDAAWSFPGQRGAMFLFGWLIVLLLIALIVWGLKRRQLWAVGGLWALAVLIPAFMLRQSGAPVTDTYAYLALPGLWLMVVEGLRTLAAKVFPKTEARFLHFGFVPVVLVFAILTFVRLPLLKNDLTLWFHMAKHQPESAVAAANLSLAYQRQANDEQAFRWAQKAAALDSTVWQARCQLADYFLNRMDIRSAAPHVDALAEFAPNRFESQATIARFYYTAGYCSAAVVTYQRAAQLGPPPANVLMGFGNALACIGAFPSAIEKYQTALLLDDNLPRVRYYIGMCYQGLGELDQAIASLRQELLLNENFAAGYESLAALYILKNDSAKASQTVRDFSKYGGSSEKIHALKLQMMDAGMDTTSFFEGKESNQ